jgi:hypothetical protein
MAYYDLSLLTQDQDFRMRCVACASTEGIPGPEPWVWEPLWELCSAPGFADAYASALAADPPVEFPGRDQSVIGDSQILAAVQAEASPDPGFRADRRKVLRAWADRRAAARRVAGGA